ncbi:Stk1 family PASTA domain-containing Ser/Thr kinase [Arachnia propionica]|uniref:non-specific serine/threonine protein kinase n=1 Tax=Arachnia propionica TaxID=1750 RepID=A0A3P1WX52_9ACTN|nr:Stk1 family PASTA domain-containing Ser/Thr kinase [Arachnia propionica]RRD50775.1 Stk1 family PASTA domain-containing Ser/Thr kinase [Arachnia propionica]
MSERGTLLGGRYELDQIIGRGGMAEVWRAHDTRLVRDVAVKRLRVDLASDPTFQARFRREAQSAAGLNHPNIVAVYDTGEERDSKSDVMVPYIVMELVEGITLREVLRDGRKILPSRALEFTAGVLDALAYSHRAGIIHRDIKPANVMLTPSGTVKVMDFGIARAVADTSATMTQTAAVIGTAQYLSPEQARGEKVDNRSDLYSVGCLMYELLCCEPPFKGDSPVSVAYQHVRETPIPPSHRDPEVTPAMDAIVLKALAKAPVDRYQDAREFRDDITRALNGQPVHAAIPVAASDLPTTVLPASNSAGARRAVMEPPTAVAEQLPPGVAPTGTLPAVEEEEEQKSRKKLALILTTVGLLIVAVVVGLWFALNPSKPAVKDVAVPTVVGSDQATAEQKLKDAQLVPKVELVESTEEQKGLVVDVDPDAGTPVPLESTVTLKVGQGPNTLKVPDLTGLDVEEAKRKLKEAGFTGPVKTEDADPATEDIKAKKGEVLSTEPSADAQVTAENEFTFVVATGTSLVPELTGRSLDDAKKEARDKGFTGELEVAQEENNDKPEGTVLKQSPDKGKPLDRGETIKVTVAVASKTAVMPDLFGMDEAQARAAFKSAGFTSELRITRTQTNDHPQDRVYQQSHPAGETLEKTAAVEISIAIPAPVSAPTSSAPPSGPPSQNPPSETLPPQPGNS